MNLVKKGKKEKENKQKTKSHWFNKRLIKWNK